MPDSEPPSVSIIMPTFNVERFVAEAIDSVIRQNLPRMELLIVDDESNDGTVKIIENKIQHYGNCIRLIEQKHQGVSAARNTAAQLARGDFIAFLDGDDLWPDGIIADHLEILKNDQVNGVQGMLSFYQHSDDSEPISVERLSPPVFSTNLGALVVRKDVFARVGLFDITLSHGEDTDWFVRAKEMRITFVQSDRLSLYYRRRSGSLTDRRDNENSTLLNVLKKKINRKKQGTSVGGPSKC